ncbi:Arf GTPase activating protein [Lichtheimia hyalospora FSU 10163]|nr:Arf GTPase activating protein [Lichtheimia hyalospora FSU 10163]
MVLSHGGGVNKVMLTRTKYIHQLGFAFSSKLCVTFYPSLWSFFFFSFFFLLSFNSFQLVTLVMFSVAQQKKQEEKNLQKVRDLLRLPGNKKCFDCPTKSPFFVNVSVQTFICSRCSGLVVLETIYSREVGHRVKSISASKFSGAEVVSLQQGGNQVARAMWLSNYGKDNVDPETDDEVRAFIRQKYYEQKWLDQEELKAHTNRVREMIKAMFTEVCYFWDRNGGL